MTPVGANEPSPLAFAPDAFHLALRSPSGSVMCGIRGIAWPCGDVQECCRSTAHGKAPSARVDTVERRIGVGRVKIRAQVT